MPTELSGVLHVWNLAGQTRDYIVVTLPYGNCRTLYQANPYSALMNTGEQRAIVHEHALCLCRAMRAGTYTPTAVHVGVCPEQARSIHPYQENGLPHVRLTVEDGDTLLLTNGAHRMEALRLIHEKASKRLSSAKTDEERTKAQSYLDTIEGLPITAILLLNGDTQMDFLNLQEGMEADPDHRLSLTIARKATGEKHSNALQLAFAVAKRLHTDPKSPFPWMFRFDSQGAASLPLSTLCTRNRSDMATSLTGLAYVGLSFTPRKGDAWLADALVMACQQLREQAPDLLADKCLLTPPPNHTRGSAAMLIGVGVGLAYRMGLLKEDKPSDRTKEALVHAARKTLDGSDKGKLSNEEKRKHIAEFIRELFADMRDIVKHQGLPLQLVEALSPSAFAAGPLRG